MTEKKESFKAILWDFDGVIMNSNQIRDNGFVNVLNDFPEEQVELLLQYHRKNGGLSRYVKFRYFFEQIRNENVTEEIIMHYAAQFSKDVMQHLTNPEMLITETVDFIKRTYHSIPMYIVSGSDQEELRKVCKEVKIGHYFKGIYGSPVPKKQLVKNILVNDSLLPDHLLLVGDSINDYEAAHENGLFFMAYNNPSIESYTTGKISLSC
jgi:HAD superfamily hydrolase (TIGR01549 family)